jgi:hypothetical protein
MQPRARSAREFRTHGREDLRKPLRKPKRASGALAGRRRASAGTLAQASDLPTAG